MLHFNDLTYRLGDRLLIDHATVALPDGARVGLVGRNGTGKTTLFHMIAGELQAETGTISLPQNCRMGRVAQEAPGGPDSLLEFVLAADLERVALLKEAEIALDPMRIAEIQTRLIDIGAHSAPARAASILNGLGFDAERQALPCSDFSGGWRMRVALAAVLFMQPDLLLLDEPTNYLDLEGALWLQDYLARYPYTVLTVSHDRDFLDAIANHILHLEQGKMTLYKGGYTDFVRLRAEKRMLLEKAAVKQNAERKHLMSFVERFRAKASKATQAQSRLKRLEKMEVIDLLPNEERVTIHLPSPEKPLSPPLIALEGVSIGYGEREVLKGLSLSITDDDRIGLLGANGNGKSTFVKLLADRLVPMKGHMKRSGRLKVAYFAQHQLDELDMNETPVTLVKLKMRDATDAKVRSKAAQLGFPFNKADTPVKNLSGGERARLLLGLAAFDGPHLLILDEPTNHLDIEMREALIRAVAEYKGAVVIVSHDRYLIDSSCDRLWIVADAKVSPYEDDLDAYAKLIVSGRSSSTKTDVAAAKLTVVPDKKPVVKIKVPLGPIKKRIEQLEAQIAKFNELLARVEKALAKPGLYRDAPELAAQYSRNRAQVMAKISELEEEWLAATAELEEAKVA